MPDSVQALDVVEWPGTRDRELRAACAVLGIASIEVLPCRDGVLQWLDIDPLIEALDMRLHDLRPDVVITFGRDGLYWHPDHIALGERVRTAVARCAAEMPVTVYAVVMPPGAMADVAARVSRCTQGVGTSFWGIAPEVFGKGALPATRIVDVAETLDVKLAALRCHTSQIDDTNPLAHLTTETAAPLAEEHFHLLETSPLHRSAFDLLARPLRMQD